MSWAIKLINKIFPRVSLRHEVKALDKKIVEIKQILKPKNQREFKELYEPLYDLIKNLPDITLVSKKTLRDRYITINVRSSADFLRLVDAFIIKDWEKLSNHIERGLIVSNQPPLKLSLWYSNKYSLDEGFTLISQLLSEAIELDNVLSNVSKSSIPINPYELERLQDRMLDFTKPEFKTLINCAVNILFFLKDCYYEDQVNNGQEKSEGRKY